MKRIFAFAVILCLLLCGCGEAVPADEAEKDPFGTADISESGISLPREEPDSLVGIGRTDASEAYEDPWGVKLTVRDATPEGLTLACRCEDAASAVTGTLQTGTEYTLERLEEGVWQPVEYIITDFGWDDVAYLIPTGETTQWEIDWQWLYGTLTAGIYRISKEVMDFREAGDFDTKIYTAEFELMEYSEGLRISCEHDGFGVSLPYVEGWEYRITEYSEEAEKMAVSFRPGGKDGWVHMQYLKWFGVCGTGMRSEEYGEGFMAIYGDDPFWTFISYPASEGCFVAMTQQVRDWWSEYETGVMEIVDGTVFTDPGK